MQLYLPNGLLVKLVNLVMQAGLALLVNGNMPLALIPDIGAGQGSVGVMGEGVFEGSPCQPGRPTGKQPWMNLHTRTDHIL